jgi:hypothetical protein
VTAGLVLSPQGAELADALQDTRDGYDAVVSEQASCTVDGTVVWEEHGYPSICMTLGGAILSAFHRAAYWDAKGLLVRPRGNRGTWYGTDGETRAWIKCRWMPLCAGE